jgi:hypothetical protein
VATGTGNTMGTTQPKSQHLIPESLILQKDCCNKQISLRISEEVNNLIVQNEEDQNANGHIRSLNIIT